MAGAWSSRYHDTGFGQACSLIASGARRGRCDPALGRRLPLERGWCSIRRLASAQSRCPSGYTATLPLGCRSGCLSFSSMRAWPPGCRDSWPRSTSEAKVNVGKLVCRRRSVQAAGFFSVHNHASGNPTPNQADINFTRGLSNTSADCDCPCSATSSLPKTE